MFSCNRRRFLYAVSMGRGCTKHVEAGWQSRGKTSVETRTIIYHGLLRRLFCLDSRRSKPSRVKLDVLSGLTDIRTADLSVQPPSAEILGKLDAAKRRMVQVIRMEMDVLRGEGRLVPDQLSDARWKELLSLRLRWKRVRLYAYWKSNELFAREDWEEKMRRREEAIKKEKERAQRPYDELEYAVDRNTIMPLLSFSEMLMCNVRLCQAMIYGPRLVVDLGFTHLMDEEDSRRCVRYITYMLAYNKYNREPFDVHLCSVKTDNWVYKSLLRSYPNLHSKDFLVNVTGKSYLDLFPKERLVYLTADAHRNLEKYKEDDVYIIGGLDSRTRAGPFTLAKAKEQGIRSARIKTGKLNLSERDSLRLDDTFRILLDFKNTGDLRKAMKHAPKPKYSEERNEIYYKYM